jgi:uncharacterized protein YqhQ
MTHKRGKAQKAWVAILAFSLFVFIVVDCGFVYYEIVELRAPLLRMVRPILLLSIMTWTVYNALQQRIKPDKQSN